MEKSAIQTRVEQYIKYKGLTNSRFEKQVGLSNGFVRNMDKGMSTDKVMRISEEFPELNILWLITGKGSMLATGTPVESSEDNQPFVHRMAETLRKQLEAQQTTIQSLTEQNKVLLQVIESQLELIKHPVNQGVRANQ